MLSMWQIKNICKPPFPCSIQKNKTSKISILTYSLLGFFEKNDTKYLNFSSMFAEDFYTRTVI